MILFQYLIYMTTNACEASNKFWNCIIAVITPDPVAERHDSAKLGSNVFFMQGGLCCISSSTTFKTNTKATSIALFAYSFVPEIKGLTLEQVDKMLEETTPRTSRKWKPHSTFAQEMNFGEKHIEIPLEHVTVKYDTTV
jgi:hypothetical protein